MKPNLEQPTPLDYEAPRPDPPTPTHPTLRAARLIAWTIIMLAGAITLGASAIGTASLTRSDCETWGTTLLAVGSIGFAIEYLAMFVRSK